MLGGILEGKKQRMWQMAITLLSNTVLAYFLIFCKEGCKWNSKKNGKAGMNIRKIFKFISWGEWKTKGWLKIIKSVTRKNWQVLYIWAVDSTCSSNGIHNCFTFYSPPPFRVNAFYFFYPIFLLLCRSSIFSVVIVLSSCSKYISYITC